MSVPLIICIGATIVLAVSLFTLVALNQQERRVPGTIDSVLFVVSIVSFLLTLPMFMKHHEHQTYYCEMDGSWKDVIREMERIAPKNKFNNEDVARLNKYIEDNLLNGNANQSLVWKPEYFKYIDSNFVLYPKIREQLESKAFARTNG